jgi:hypothetical protein
LGIEICNNTFGAGFEINAYNFMQTLKVTTNRKSPENLACTLWYEEREGNVFRVVKDEFSESTRSFDISKQLTFAHEEQIFKGIGKNFYYEKRAEGYEIFTEDSNGNLFGLVPPEGESDEYG